MLKRIIESQVVEYLGKPSQNVLCLNKYENTTIPIEGGSIMPLSRPEQNPPWLPYLPFPVQMLVTMSTSYGLNYANHEKSAKTKRRGEKAAEGGVLTSRQTSRGDAAKTGMAIVNVVLELIAINVFHV